MFHYVFLPLKPNYFESLRNDCRNAKLYFQMTYVVDVVFASAPYKSGLEQRKKPRITRREKNCFHEVLKSNLQKFNTTGTFVVPITENYKNVIYLIDKLLVCR